MSHKRFVFDDEIEDLQPTNIKEDTSKSLDREEKSMKKSKQKKKSNKQKKKFKKRYLVLVLLALITVFVVYVFIAGGNDGPVYGDRCASLIAIDKDKLNNVEDSIKSDPNIDAVEIEVDCRIIKITMNFIDNTTSDSAKQLATNALHTLDDTLGNHKSNEESQYSDLFGMANGRGQYNVEFVLTSNGDSNFPIFGTKHPGSDEISFTGANIVDQKTTDQVLKKDQTQ